MDLSVDELNILCTALETHGIKTEAEAMLYSRLCLAVFRIGLCVDEGCPQHGKVHVCHSVVRSLEDDFKDVQEERDYGWSR